MKSAIITGATGFIGYHFTQELLANGVQVTALCRECSPRNGRLPDNVNLVYSLDDLLHADVFYHLAWEDASGSGRANPKTQTQNVLLAIDALNAAVRLGCGKFVILGTIYEKFAPQIRKKARFDGSDFYIMSKEYTHAMTNSLAYKLGIDYTYVTVCHPFGKYVKPEQMLASVMLNLLDGKTIKFGLGMEYYDIVAVENLALGLRLLGKLNLPEREYYVGSGSPRLLRDYLLEAKQILGVDTPIEFGARPHDGLRFESEWFDVAPVSQDTGYTTKESFGEIIRGAEKWLKSSI